MAALSLLDTHVVVWLYQGRVDLLSRPARSAIEADDLLISPISVLELQFLHEIDRLAVAADEVLGALGDALGLRLCDASLADVVAAGRTLRWTRDPFDRLIVGHAAAEEHRLVTGDRAIRAHYPLAVW